MIKNSTYPWLISGFACLALMVSNGMTITGLSVYDEQLLNEFGWNRGELKFRDMVTFMVTGLTAPFIGILLDRFGVRVCMAVGWVLLGIAYFFYGTLTSLAQLYLVHVLMGLVLVVCGLNAAVILVSHWFVSRRGTAIGIALVGSSLGGAVFPQYGTLMIGELGWRGAFQSAIIFPLIMLVLVTLFLRNRPVDKGMQPYGGSESKSAEALEGMEYLTAIKTRTFWALALIAMSTFYSVLGIQAHLFLHMRDMAFDVATATNAISLFFLLALIGKFAFGFLADYINYKLVFAGNILVMVAGAFCLASMQQPLIWVAVVAFGLGWGGVYTILQLTVMDIFGLKAAGKILGTITVLDALGGGLGIWLTGVFYATTGNYGLAFKVFVGLILLALVCVTQISKVASEGSPAKAD